ncbi:MAG: hypothetical protein KG029_08750 [Bacteroidetes bacterium]|nr:hypothetical protein [Bacteroidota bacterium]
MTPQAVDPRHFVRRMRQIRANLPDILSRWGLLPKFKRWRLAQDPDTGTVVLFGVLDNHYIATHTTTPFSNYFEPRLLHDLATELGAQVIPSASDGLRYAFILDKGQVEIQPSVNNRPISQSLSHVQKIVVDNEPPPPKAFVLAEEHRLEHEKLDRFVKIADALEAEKNDGAQPVPEILLMNETEFKQLMAKYEDERNKKKE